jgi:hypothetical protein
MTHGQARGQTQVGGDQSHYKLCMFRLGDIGKQEKKMRSELAQFKRQLQAQRDASALELRRLQHPSPSLGGSTSVPASALSASTASNNTQSTGNKFSGCS